MTRVILLRADAPAKPPAGAACNGCGVCCAAEPCPLGVLLSGRTRGRCAALHWDAPQARYLCGAIAQPARHLPRPLRGFGAPLLARLARRLVAAAAGCDSDAEVAPAPLR